MSTNFFDFFAQTFWTPPGVRDVPKENKLSEEGTSFSTPIPSRGSALETSGKEGHSQGTLENYPSFMLCSLVGGRTFGFAEVRQKLAPLQADNLTLLLPAIAHLFLSSLSFSLSVLSLSLSLLRFLSSL